MARHAVVHGASGSPDWSFLAGSQNTGEALSTFLIATADALNRANLVLPTADAGGRYYDLNGRTDYTYDARGEAFPSEVASEADCYVTRLGNTSRHTRSVWVGGYVTTDVPTTYTWKQVKSTQSRDGTGLLARASHWLVVDGARYYNVMDGVRPQVAASGGYSAHSIRNCWMEYIRDDLSEMDGGISGGEYHDNLIDGCFMGFSFQAGTVTGAPEDLHIRHNLVRLAPMPYDTDVGNSAPLFQSTYGVNAPRHAQMWKQWDSTDPVLVVEDNVFFIEQHSVNGAGSMAFPTGARASYARNELIWIGDPANPAAYPGTLPASGITEYNLLTNTEAELRAMWAAHKATWKTRHGFASTAAITDEPLTPAKLIAPDDWA